jgi:hypothetical protein
MPLLPSTSPYVVTRTSTIRTPNIWDQMSNNSPVRTWNRIWLGESPSISAQWFMVQNVDCWSANTNQHCWKCIFSAATRKNSNACPGDAWYFQLILNLENVKPQCWILDYSHS